VKLNPNPQRNELHAFWDDVLGTAQDPGSAIRLGRRLAPADPALAGDTQADHWVNESFQDAKADVYISPIGNDELMIAKIIPVRDGASQRKDARSLATTCA